MAFDDRTCWLIRPGGRSRLPQAFVTHGLVSIAWEWDGIADLRATEDAEIFLALQAAGRRKPADDLRDLRMFANRLSTGDVVVVPDPLADDLLLGEIAGEYDFEAGRGVHRHARPMRWFGRVATAHVDDVLLTSAAAKDVIRRLSEQRGWQRLAGEVADFLGRDPSDVPLAARKAAARTATPRPRARASAPAKPARAAVPDRLCPGCGLLRAPTLFAGDEEYCRDCA